LKISKTKNSLITLCFLLVNVNLLANNSTTVDNDITKEGKCINILLEGNYNKNNIYDRTCIAKFITNHINVSNLIENGIDNKLKKLYSKSDIIVYEYDYSNESYLEFKTNNSIKQLKYNYCHNNKIIDSILNNNLKIRLIFNFNDSKKQITFNKDKCNI